MQMQPLFLAMAVFAAVFSCNYGISQTTARFPDIALGQWRQHLPWQRAFFVAQSESKAYLATEWAVVEVDKTERTPRFITRIEGLSDAGIERIGFNRATRSLLIVYQNSNIDLWRADNGSVRNVPIIVLNRQIVGDRRVYDIAFDGAFAYVACGFGVLKLNVERAEVVFTTFTDAAVRTVEVHQGYLYASTTEGFFRLPLNDANPADFGRWEALGPMQGLPQGFAAGDMVSYKNLLFIGLGRALCRYNGAKLDTIGWHPEFDVSFLTAEGTGLVIGRRKGFNGNIQYMEGPFAGPYEIHWVCDASNPIYCIEDGTRRFWIADYKDDFRYYNAATEKCDRFRYNSPYRESVSEIEVAHGRVLVATPGNEQTLAPLYNRAGLYIREPDGQWSRLYEGTQPELVPSDSHVDLWRVAAHPFVPDKFYVGSFWGGLVEATGVGKPAKAYTKDNSILQSAGIAGTNRTAIGGLAFDGNANLWISNYSAPQRPIAVLKADGTLRNFTAPVNNLLQVAVDRNGYKWFVVGFNGGLLVYDSGRNIDDPTDDSYRQITTANSVLPTNTVNCVAVDLDGDVWVGTLQGIVSFQCGANAFRDICRGTRRIVNVDGFNGYLLENESVQTIAVDGANRKWVGTTNGIFVLSPSGDAQIARFTATNSPLLDNNIRDIAIDHTTGEVWIATNKGILSYRAEATQGGPTHSDKPYAYPNPVRPDYDGPIAIYGLARDANVKITDVAGNLVYEGRAAGGQAIWNGRDYLGRRVASGVYTVFATSTRSLENPEGVVAKIVILN
ncbi:MAG: hypothetical protein NZM41_14370 [Saprospiraceae bacterium]|nr:hypothetical protein [Saprospiraceae bacterium]